MDGVIRGVVLTHGLSSDNFRNLGKHETKCGRIQYTDWVLSPTVRETDVSSSTWSRSRIETYIKG